jgi:3-hydroxyacyl-CoA dehydrogenase/enoyl-CoA hydratase/3-hydroxybutyryl-CoA epimerase
MDNLFSGNAFKLSKKGDIGFLDFDLAGSKVNKLGYEPFADLEKICSILKNHKLKVVLVRSLKKQSFIVGADIQLIQSLKDRSEALKASSQGQSIFNVLEDLSIPTIAAIEGPCMGGGTELALACKYRIASDHEKTAIAVPEIKLGFLPGWGGCYRLRLLEGLPNALDMILTGKNIRADKALKMGLVNAVVPSALFFEKALQYAEEIAKTGECKAFKKKTFTFQEKFLSKQFIGKKIVLTQAQKGVVEQTRGNYPAPLRVIKLMDSSLGSSRESFLDAEANAFADLWATPESRNLVNLFFLVEDAKKNTGTTLSDDSLKNIAPVQTLGVLGAGVMGGGIAAQSATFGLRTTVKDLATQALQKALSHAQGVFDKEVKKKKINKTQCQNRMGLIRTQLDYAGFKGLDLVIEAVVENLDVKKKVLAELETQVGPQCLIGSNTSSLKLTEMAKALKDSSRFVGIHFFNPVEKMPLVEVVSHSGSSQESIAKAVNYVKAIGKTPVVVKDGPGFLVNRLLIPWLNESAYLLDQGLSIERLDKVAKKFGMPMGPFELLDEIGIDVAAKVAHILAKDLGERAKASGVFDIVAAAPEVEGRKRWGRKSGLGFYLWDKPAGKRLTADTAQIDALISSLRTKNSVQLTDQEIIERMFYPMVNEAALALKEGITETPNNVDLGMIFGTGFPPFRGGLCRWADDVGVQKIVDRLAEHQKSQGIRLKPTDALVEVAKRGRFYTVR